MQGSRIPGPVNQELSETYPFCQHLGLPAGLYTLINLPSPWGVCLLPELDYTCQTMEWMSPKLTCFKNICRGGNHEQDSFCLNSPN